MELDEMPDARLLEAVAARDEAALRELYDRHAPLLLLRLRRRSPDPDLAAEAVHDTFVAAWRSAESFRGEGDVAAWLWGIAVRRLISRLRARPAPTPVSDEVVSALSPPALSAEDRLLQLVEHGDVGTALRTLSPELRQAIQATVLDGLTTREAARLLGIPHGTVKSRVRLAKGQLRTRLVQVEGW